jgi:hypothetical protein
MLKRIKNWIALRRAAPQLLKALEDAHLEIISLLNEGDFKRHVVLDLGYIVEAVAAAKNEKVPPREDRPYEYEFDESYDT